MLEQYRTVSMAEVFSSNVPSTYRLCVEHNDRLSCVLLLYTKVKINSTCYICKSGVLSKITGSNFMANKAKPQPHSQSDTVRMMELRRIPTHGCQIIGHKRGKVFPQLIVRLKVSVPAVQYQKID